MQKKFFIAALVMLIPVLGMAQVNYNHELLNCVTYNQTAGEYTAVCEQAYELAKVRLDEALADTSWTAVPEQTGNFQSLPPAVILDVDETVLNNSPYEAWLIKENSMFDSDSWDIWVQHDYADAIPGAVEFCNYAKSKGVAVYYVTNRENTQEAATLRNLMGEGFPVDKAGEMILTKNEQDDWGSDKTTRRAFLAQNYRILLVVGDDANDFVTGTRAGTADRNAVIEQNIANFGTKWILLTNDMYGGWELGIFNRDYSLTFDQRIQAKYEAVESFETMTPPGSWTRETGQSHELLHAVLWVETAGEYDGYCTQAYELAKIRLQEALNDSTWTAAYEQTGDYQSLEPCVVLDVDETVLDNVDYEGSLILLNSQFDSESWTTWVNAAQAKPVAGAVEFTQFADAQGVKVIYVTNRTAEEEAGTLKNLKDLGFPIDENGENLLTKGEQSDWGSDKTTRRSFLAENHRILLLVGDDANDFVTGTRASTIPRNNVIHSNMDMFGTKWIIVPNAMYGGWEAGTYNRDYSLTYEQKLAAKISLLDVATALEFRSNFEDFSLYK
jgi:5'-nucleotidase (lipoprotein e(P4) family)